LNPPTRISLVGFMGSGKSTVGRLLADRIGHRYIDSDEAIEARAKAPITEIFRDQGEAAFRALERETIAALLDEETCVIATGGGAFAQDSCAEDLLARSFTVHLRCELSEALRRAAAPGGRPLLERRESEVAALYAERKDKYARAQVTVETTHRSPDEVVADILRLLVHP